MRATIEHPISSFHAAVSVNVRLIAWLLLLGFAGCRTYGPDIARFEPSSLDSIDPAWTEWSGGVWNAAVAGDVETARRLLDDLPRHDTTLNAWITRLRSLDDERTMQVRREVMRDLDLLDDPTGDEDIRIEALADLAEHLDSVEEPWLVDRIVSTLDRAIVQWSRRAEKAEANRDVEEATRCWRVVQSISRAGRHPDRELDAMRRTARLAARSAGRGRSTPLPPRVLKDVARRVLETHVDPPSWRSMIDAGFATLEDSVSSCEPEDRAAVTQRLAGIRAAFDAEVEATPIGEDALPLDVAIAVDVAAGALAASRDSGRLPDLFPDPIALFIEGMLSSTDLRTRAYLGSDAAAIERLLGTSFVGIGARLRPEPDGWSLQPLAGSPAMKAGVRRGDRLESVDGRSIEGMTAQEIITAIGGRRGNVVEIEVRREGIESSLPLLITLDDVEMEVVHGCRQLGTDANGRPRWDWILDREAGIAFISIREFDVETDIRFREAMREANAALGEDRIVQGLVIDLRDNPGGHREVTERLLDLFLFRGDVFRARGRDDELENTPARASITRLAGLPVVLLVDEHSASASELLAGTLQGGTDAVVVGERTFGKGSVQGIHRERDGFTLVTESWFLVPENDTASDPSRPWRFLDRARTDTWGVSPQWPVPATSEETDRALESTGHWTSGRGQDQDEMRRPDSLATCEDRALLRAAILLRARLLPSTVVEGDPTPEDQ